MNTSALHIMFPRGPYRRVMNIVQFYDNDKVLNADIVMSWWPGLSVNTLCIEMILFIYGKFSFYDSLCPSICGYGSGNLFIDDLFFICCV